MKIKLDENVPITPADELSALGHDADTTPGDGLEGKIDEIIWEATQQSGRSLTIRDPDFSDLWAFAPGTHHGLLVRLHAPARRRLIERIRFSFSAEAVDTWVGCCVIATERSPRVHQAESPS